jgi:hypothetical protein
MQPASQTEYLMKPSTLRYIRLEQDIWSLLWRIMPKACKEVGASKHYHIKCQYPLNKQQTINVKHK